MSRKSLLPSIEPPLFAENGGKSWPTGTIATALAIRCTGATSVSLAQWAVLLHVAEHRAELARQEAVGIGEREQQRLQVDALGRRLGLVGRDRVLVDVALARERVDEVRVVPGLRRHRRIRQVAVDQHARGALQAAVDQRDQQPLARRAGCACSASCSEQVLVGDRQLARERQRGLRRLERFAGQRMRARTNCFSSCGHSVLAVAQYCSASSSRFESLMATRLVAASASPMTRAASTGSRCEILVEPRDDLGRTDFRRIGRPRVDRRQARVSGMSWSISGWPSVDCKRIRQCFAAARPKLEARSRPRVTGGQRRARNSTTGSIWSADEQHRRVADAGELDDARLRARARPSAPRSRPRAGRIRAPRSTSVGQRIASHSGHRSGGAAVVAKRHGDAGIVGQPPAAVRRVRARWSASGGPIARR